MAFAADENAMSLLHAQVWTLNAGQRILLANLHHSITDGGSVAVMQRELADAYAALLEGGKVTWAPLPVQVRSANRPPLQTWHDRDADPVTATLNCDQRRTAARGL